MDPVKLAARAGGRCYWEVELANGRAVTEIETDWQHLPSGRATIRLITPKGPNAPWIAGYKDDTVFQLKPALFRADVGRVTLGHVIGAVIDESGDCLLYAYDYRSSRLCLQRDNIFNLRYGNLGPLALENVGVRL